MISMRTKNVFAAVIAAGFSIAATAPLQAADPAPKAQAGPAMTKSGNRYCLAASDPRLKNVRVCKTRDQWVAERGIDPAAK